MVVLLVVVTSGGKLVGDVTLGVVDVFVAVVLFVVVVVAGADVKVDANRVVSFSWWCVVVEIVGVCGDHEEGGRVVEVVVGTSTFPVSGGTGVASVPRCGVIGLCVVVPTL
jgi:hypothetical protein